MRTTDAITQRSQTASFVLPVVTLTSSTLTPAPRAERLEGRRDEPMAVVAPVTAAPAGATRPGVTRPAAPSVAPPGAAPPAAGPAPNAAARQAQPATPAAAPLARAAVGANGARLACIVIDTEEIPE